MIQANQYFSLAGKVALVTGGYGGIGKVVCGVLAAMGARIAVTGHSLEKAQACAEALRSEGADVYAGGFEVTNVPEIGRMVDDVAAHFGQLDILVNTVGAQREEKAGDATEVNFDYVLDVNLKGSLFQAQAAARHSVRSQLALRGRGFAAYSAAKRGLPIMCRQLAAEWAADKISVNVIAPTFVRTPQVELWLSDPEFYRNLIARIPLGRVGDPEDVAGAVLFLASKASDFITGQTLYLDGGVTATQ